jgi:hypothetical protein
MSVFVVEVYSPTHTLMTCSGKTLQAILEQEADLEPGMAVTLLLCDPPQKPSFNLFGPLPHVFKSATPIVR